VPELRGITRRLALALLPSGLAGAWLGRAAAEVRPEPRPEGFEAAFESEGGPVFEEGVFEPGVFE
jgi:hypothetical protein